MSYWLCGLPTTKPLPDYQTNDVQYRLADTSTRKGAAGTSPPFTRFALVLCAILVLENNFQVALPYNLKGFGVWRNPKLFGVEEFLTKPLRFCLTKSHSHWFRIFLWKFLAQIESSERSWEKKHAMYSLMNMRQLHILFNVIVCWFLCFAPNLLELNPKLFCSDVQNNIRLSSGKFGAKHRNQQTITCQVLAELNKLWSCLTFIKL